MIDSDAPRLETRDLQQEVTRMMTTTRDHHLLAFYGTGDEVSVEVEGIGRVPVIPVRSELELREKMPKITEENPRAVFLVPFAQDIPIDLAGRFALSGRVRRIGKEVRLARMFGVAEADVEASRSALAEWLLAGKDTKRIPISESRLTHDLLWSAWLRSEWGLDTEGGLALDALLAWASLDGRGSFFREGPGAVARLRDELMTVLERALGPAGPLAWKAWEEGRGADVLHHALLFEALIESQDGAVRMWLKQRVKTRLGVGTEAALIEVPIALGRAATSALRYVERTTNGAAVRAVLRSAEELVDDQEVRAALLPSLRLPSAFEARLDALGATLLAEAKAPSRAGLAEATERLRAVEVHTLSGETDNQVAVRRAWMALRLLAFLVARPDRAVAMGATPYASVEALSQWYAMEGGFVDWARRTARDTADGRFGQGVQAIVTAADDVRAELDRIFARGLVEWVAAGQPASQVVPIDQAIERVAVRFLDERDDRRLLILLLDGMAWAQAAELLESLATMAWGPLAWNQSKTARVGSGFYVPMLAALPSVTEVSRSAFFGSKPTARGRSEDTQQDRQRFRDNKKLKKYFPATAAPTLLLRSDSHTKGGTATEESLRLVGDASQRVVGIVINAIDDSLKSNPSLRHSWGVASIASLEPLLTKARETGRAVLLASDHGHVPADLLEYRGSPAHGGARWRALASESDPVQSFEVAFRGERAWAPRDAAGIALFADDRSRWGSSTHAGEHGGATLAEVVAPCVLVGAEDLRGSGNDEGLGIQPPWIPSWWHLELPRPPIALPDEAPVKSGKTKVPENQLALPVIAPAPAPARVASTARTPVSEASAPSAFARSEVLKARVPDAAKRREVVRAVDFLLARNGVAADAVFASEMNVLAFRVGGFVASLQETLNMDGYEVVRFDAAGRQVHLDVGKLRSLFEVST